MEKVIEKVFNGYCYVAMVLAGWWLISILDIGLEINKLPLNAIKLWLEWAM